MMNTTSRLDSIQSLRDEILQIQKENSRDIKALDRVQEIIKKSTELTDDSSSTNEMLIDAKILFTGSMLVSSHISSFDTNLTSFDEVEYKRGIFSYMRCNSDLGKSWECFAPVTYHFFKKTHPLSFMLGTFALSKPIRKEKVTKERMKRVFAEKTKVCSSLQKPVKENLKENIICEHLLKSLLLHYKKNNKKPIALFDFVIDPTSYWKSVENIFHLSFLVHDGSVSMTVDNNEMPHIEPIPKKNERSELNKMANYQFSLKLSHQDWKRCIQKFSIESAKITPL